MDPIIRQKIKELGDVLSPELLEATIKLYLPLLARAARERVRVTRNIPYGSHERQKLDIYGPDQQEGAPFPVLVFIHGGGFVMGNKDEYRNIGNYFARQGILTVIPSYRLAPEFTWPSGAQDVADVIRLTKKEVSAYGGNPDRLVLMGHSAGAAHVASCLYDSKFTDQSQKDIQGSILMSCPVLDPHNVNELEQIYYGNDPSKYHRMSILHQIGPDTRPMFIITAQYDPVMFHDAAVKLIKTQWQQNKTMPIVKTCIHHNHISEVMQFNTGDESIGPDLAAFIKTCSE